MHTYTDAVHLMSSTKEVKYESTGAIKYLSTRDLITKCIKGVKNN